jgi:hypothetical protein
MFLRAFRPVTLVSSNEVTSSYEDSNLVCHLRQSPYPINQCDAARLFPRSQTAYAKWHRGVGSDQRDRPARRRYLK